MCGATAMPWVCVHARSAECVRGAHLWPPSQQVCQEMDPSTKLPAGSSGGDASSSGTSSTSSSSGGGGGASTSGGGGGGDPLLALRRLMTFSRRFARNLRVTRLPSRLDPQIIFDAMVK